MYKKKFCIKIYQSCDTFVKESVSDSSLVDPYEKTDELLIIIYINKMYKINLITLKAIYIDFGGRF